MPRLIGVAVALTAAAGLVVATTAGGERQYAAPHRCAATSSADPSTGAATRPSAESDAITDSVTGAVTDVVGDAELGLLVHDSMTGGTLAEHAADRRFPSASLVKLLIAAHVLAGDVGERDRADINPMLARSDDPIASRLWVAAGADDLVTTMADRIGLTGTEPPEQAGQWGQASTTAADVVAMYEYIAADLAPSARAPIMAALRSTTARGADGFDQSYGLPAAFTGTNSAVKQGWMRLPEEFVLHTTGRVGPDGRYVVGLLASFPPDTSDVDGRAALSAGAGTLAAELPDAPER